MAGHARHRASWLTVPAAIEFLRRSTMACRARIASHALARHAHDTLTQRFQLAPVAQDDDDRRRWW